MADLEDFSLAEWDRICLDNLLSTSTDHVYFKDSCSRFIRVSTGVVDAATQPRAELRGMPVVGEADLLGRTDFDVFHDTSAQAAFDVEQGIIRTGAPVLEVIERQTWPDRPPTYVTTSKRPLRGPDGQIIGTFGISRDVTDDLLVRSQLESVLLTSPDAISRLDPQLRFVYVNPAAEDVFGLPAAQILGKTDEQLDDRGFFAEFWHATLRRVVDTGEPARLQHESGGGEDIRYFESHVVAELDVDVVTGVLVLTRDITDRRRAELAVAELALHDPLTGLANRVLLLDRLQQSLVRLERGTGMVAVLFLDLDRFKAVNDTWGHAFGDALLVETAERLLTCARRSDTVARLGGDEFVMVCDRISAVDDARVVADRLTSVLAMPFSYEGNTVSLSASIGIATAADPRTTADELIRNADVAMYQAKERGRGTGSSHLFDASSRDRSPSRQSLEYELGTALEEGQLSLHYQPLHDLGTGVVHGVEALVRWQHPSRGLLQPHDFMPVAERSGLVVPLGAWVLDEACRQLASWNAARAGKPPLTVSVNLSARQLSSPGNVDMVAATLARHHVPPALLCLEISETTLLEEAVSTPESLTALHGIGVLIALDSFGTGYSSLAHLRRFPVDIIKIDREFVSAISVTPQGSELAGAIAAMAHALGMKTVGEGVETAAQLAALQQFGCDDAQGFLLSRPMPAEELTALLAATP